MSAARYYELTVFLPDAVNVAIERKRKISTLPEWPEIRIFLNDVGLLSSMFMDGIQVKILNGEINMNFGAVYENFAAQELKAHGFGLYYFNSKKQGELDFLIETEGKVVPLEIKSGKDYKRHAALTSVMNNPRYDISEGIVYQNENVGREGKILYLPVYMIMFQQRSQEIGDMPLNMNFSVLRKE